MNLWTYVIAASLAFMALIFYSAERSFGLFSWTRLEEIETSRSRRQALEQCLEERELVISAFFVLGTLLISASAAVFYSIATQWHQKVEVAALVLGVVWLLPELVAWRFGDKLSLRFVPPLYFLVRPPFRAIRRLFARPARPAAGEAATAAQAGEAESPDAEAREMFRMTVRLQHLQVREIMTPRTDMVTIADTATLQQAAQVSLQSGYTRIPVHRGNRDQIVGVLHAKDLLQFASTEKWNAPALPEIVRQAFFVPETKTVSELMEELQRNSIHMGIVLDEYGGTRGLVTLEDVMEELVGEIHDEYESAAEEPPLYRWIDARTLEARSVMRIEEFNEEFNSDLPEQDDYDTLGGYVMFVLGKIPAKGDTFTAGRAHFTVVEADARHVIRVRVEFEEEPRPVEKP